VQQTDDWEITMPDDEMPESAPDENAEMTSEVAEAVEILEELDVMPSEIAEVIEDLQVAQDVLADPEAMAIAEEILEPEVE
jgi:hypothetical protein